MIRVTGLGRATEDTGRARERLAAVFGEFGAVIERLAAHFDEVPGQPAYETVCRVRVALRHGDAVVCDARGTDVTGALEAAASAAVRQVRHAIARAKPSGDLARERSGAAAGQIHEGLMGRREGHGEANLARALERPEKLRRDQPVDTAEVGVSATDRKAGGGHTARRNTKRHTRSGQTFALEDSLQQRPSRKSTRGSGNAVQNDNQLGRRTLRKVHAPETRARAARARATRVSG